MVYESGYSDSISMPGTHKTGNSPGERMLALYVEGSGTVDEKMEYFSDISSFIITKKDLVVYLRKSYEEYHHRTRACNEKINYQELYDENLSLIQSLDKNILHLHYQASIRNNGTQVYLNLVGNDDLNVFKQYLWPILIPNQQSPRVKYTKFRLNKFIFNNTNYIYMKPEFKKEYSISELVDVLKRYLSDESKPKDVTLHKFVLRMCNFIEDADKLTYICEQLGLSEYCEDAKRFFYVCKELINEKVDLDLSEVELLHKTTQILKRDVPLQQIFYGAPGTGKSHCVNEVIEAQPEENVFRTTFHPDSDYSTFVGCYKPTKVPQKQPILDYDSLVDKLKEYLAIEPVNITRSCALFGYDYHDSIVKMQDGGGHTIPSLVADAYKSGTTYDSTVRAGMSIYENGVQTQKSSSTITYTFVPQAFTKAYLRAWQTEDPVYLVIEEINRGNCAQIFGDLFQLLDRKGGKSEYPIKPDTDLGNFIAENLTSPVEGAPEKVVKGELMILPKNLYIWATMNTSDQSLFPIDSAFKRRWDWVYIPISASEEDNFGIKVGKLFYDWGQFISKMNLVVAKVTSSEDKQLGYYFCKADEGSNIISANRFVNKVLFYLWNDVFKNYGFDAMLDGKAVFKYKNDEGKDEIMSFTSFYTSNGFPNSKQIKRLMDNLGLEGVDEWLPEETKENSNDGTPKIFSAFYNGNEIEGQTNKDKFLKTLELIVKDVKADEVANVIGGEMIKNPPTETTRDYRKVGDTDWYVATKNSKDRFVRHLKNLRDNLDLNLDIK